MLASFCRTLRLPFAVLSALTLSAGALAEPEALLELREVQRVAFERSGAVWLATPNALYELRAGTIHLSASRPGTDDYLALAPGGEAYGWLRRNGTPPGLLTGQLYALPATQLAELRLPGFPSGFKKLYLGASGKLVVTTTPLDDAEGVGGRFMYVFWSLSGTPVAKQIFDGRRSGVLDASGAALLLKGESDAVAFNASGQELWRREGAYGVVATAAGGAVALLQSADELTKGKEVALLSGGTWTSLTLPGPVKAITLAPDGLLAAVVVEDRRVFVIDVLSRHFTEIPSLPIGGTSHISAVRFLDADTLAVGTIRREGASPPFAFPDVSVLALSVDGQVLFNRTLELKQRAWAPSIDATYGIRRFAAYTPDQVLVVDLSN